jgi:hypothetical protein
MDRWLDEGALENVVIEMLSGGLSNQLSVPVRVRLSFEPSLLPLNPLHTYAIVGGRDGNARIGAVGFNPRSGTYCLRINDAWIRNHARTLLDPYYKRGERDRFL